ncbi:MAG: endolytic transglycosylase MltG [Tannerella sp.]|nr:endolytic transglycosylase MltG [Tannerella sp.]
MKKITKRLLSVGILIVLVVVAACGAIAYGILYMPNFNLSETKYVYIYEDRKDFDALCEELRDSADCKHIDLFKILADFREYPENMKSGRFAVEPGMNNNTLLNRLRRGQQTPVRLTFNNLRLVSDLTTRLSDQLMIDNDDLLSYLGDDEYCGSLGFNTATVKAMFIPNTYEVYWNIPAEKLIERMKREYDAFWNEGRLEKAKELRMSPVEVSILASIVEEETAVPDEYPVVAGLYINRLHKGMPLQADPTVKYAVGDFSLRRVLNKHLEVESPYNTYLHEGLPPGPIRIPSVRGIDAVLNHTKHNYFYMCAKEDFSGRHNFAVTLSEHNRNADKYRAELNRRGIK